MDGLVGWLVGYLNDSSSDQQTRRNESQRNRQAHGSKNQLLLA